MSSPSSVSGNNASIGIREGTRVILREITANLQNSPPGTSPRRKNGNDTSSNKADQQEQQHDVKVRFIREFADATCTTGRDAVPESSSLSSASSFQSLASTLSSKCSSGICVDSSPSKNSDSSYLCADIPGLDDLISACENIRLDETTKEHSSEAPVNSEDNSPNETFTSAIDAASFNHSSSSDSSSSDDSPLNSPNDEANGNHNIIHKITNDISSINRSNLTNPDLNVTTDIIGENSSLNRQNETDTNLNTIGEEIRGISPKNCSNTAGSDLNITANARKDENSFSNPNDRENFDLNVTREITRDEEDSSLNLPYNENPDLNVTIEIASGETALSCPDLRNSDLNVTREITRDEDSSSNLPNNENPDLNVTIEIASEKTALSCSDLRNSDLNVTIELTGEGINSSDQFDPEIDTTRELTSENSSLNPYQDETNRLSTINTKIDAQADELVAPFRNLDGKIEESLANTDLETQTVEYSRESCATPEVKKTNETFVRCFRESVEFSCSNENAKVSKNLEIAVTDAATGISTFSRDKDPEKFDRYEEYPLESLTPSISKFHENNFPSSPSRVNEKINESQISIGEKSSFRDIIVDQTDSLINEFTKIPDDLNATKDLPVPEASSIEKTADLVADLSQNASLARDNDKNEEISTEVASLTGKFVAIPDKQFIAVDTASTLPESTFFAAEQLLDPGVEFNEANKRKLEASLTREEDNIEEAADSRDLVIEKDRKELKNKEKKEETAGAVEKVNLTRILEISEERSVKEEKIGEKEADPKSPAIEKAISAEFFDKPENRPCEDLDSTVNVDELNIDDIFGIPETDRYAEFKPERQSTSLVRQLESCKSSLISGAAIDDDNLTSEKIALNDDYASFVPQKQSTNIDDFSSPKSSKLARQRTPFVTALTISEDSPGNGDSASTNEALPVSASPSKKLLEDASIEDKKPESIEDPSNFAKLEIAANSVADDILNTSLELAEENEHFVSAESEVFQDPTSFDFLLSKTPRKNTNRNLRDLSLYVKFDPLVSNASMLPQGNIQNPSPPSNEARNGDKNTKIGIIGTPKCSPAITAIDRLLFYSPMSANTTPPNTNVTIQKTNDGQEKLKPTEETSEETINMAKELELVRTTVLQLEEQLEKLKIDHEEALEKQTSDKEKINQLQAQLAQEIKNKNEITVVVDEYEISISRLVAEKERDRKNLDLEKAKLQEELAAAKHHLDNTEAAFNDVHLKYERLKAVVASYKINEAALQKSLQGNVEIIKSLENRYEQVKSHATARLEKANQDLEEIRKQNESETVRLHAMLRKAELKSNSLAELVEQKTKENKELTQILDELIARVGCNKSE